MRTSILALNAAGEAAQAQRERITRINSPLGTLDQMTQQSAALVEQSAAAAESLSDQSARLSDAVQAVQCH